jgi:UDP-N-acetylmuramyl pentapeptide phosphotransferase/UDP-N-acetylglucosamine-1-phosphate transferase
VLAAGLAAAGAGAAYRLRAALPEGWRMPFVRTNHAGEEVTLLEGPAYVLGAGAGAVLAGPGPALATAAAGLLGGIDDLAGDSSSKGLRGHLGALAHGRLTTGGAKVLGLAVGGLATAVLVDRRARREGEADAAGTPGALGTLVGGAVVAGAANLVNLLDLRPGRALKATQLASAVLLAAPSRAGATSAGAALGACLPLLAPDLREEAMLGDTGANAAGALLGSALVERLGTRGRLVTLAILTGLTLASEKVSFTRVIESTPGLRELDALGRRPR